MAGRLSSTRVRDALALTLAGALVRLPSLGTQSLHRDEAFTVGSVISASPIETLKAISDEASPPLYYVLAWFPVNLFGAGEVSGRAVAAIAGVLVVPVAYEIGRTLASRRVGLVLGALTAVNPYLFWFSQEARPYTLLVLFGALSFLFFVRSLQCGDRLDLALWAASSMLAFASHWFAGSLVAVEAAVLLWRAPERRDVTRAVAATGAAALLLAPLFFHQAARGGGTWIGDSELSDRARQTGEKFIVGELGSRVEWALPVTIALVGIAVLLLVARGGPRERRAAGFGLLAAAAAMLLPALPAIVGKDYLIDKNVLAGLLPLTLVAAAGFGARRAGLTGLAAGGALVVAWGWLVVLGTFDPDLRRPPWGEAVKLAGPPSAPRAFVTPYNSDASIKVYLPRWRELFKGSTSVREVVVVSKNGASPRPRGFRLVERRTTDKLQVSRFRSHRMRSVSYLELARMDIGGGCSPDRTDFGCERAVVLLDG